MPFAPTALPEDSVEYSPETQRALQAMSRAFAETVLENHRFGLPVIQYVNGEVVETPAEELLPLARRILENADFNGIQAA